MSEPFARRGGRRYAGVICLFLGVMLLTACGEPRIKDSQGWILPRDGWRSRELDRLPAGAEALAPDSLLVFDHYYVATTSVGMDGARLHSIIRFHPDGNAETYLIQKARPEERIDESDLVPSVGLASRYRIFRHGGSVRIMVESFTMIDGPWDYVVWIGEIRHGGVALTGWRRSLHRHRYQNERLEPLHSPGMPVTMPRPAWNCP